MHIVSQNLLVSNALAARKLEGHKNLGGDTAGTADLNQPVGYSISQGISLSTQTGEKLARGCCLETGWILVDEE